MTKVKILTDVSDLSGVHQAGDEAELEDARAAEYVKSGIAEELAPQPEGTRAAAPEAAMLGNAPEQAALPRARPRGL